jgi:hypothetical protein
MIDIASGEVEDREPTLEDNESAASMFARKGGEARASKLTAKRRKEIAQKVAQSRWKRK